METITDFMSADHGRCDELYVAAEQAASEGQWEKAAEAFRAFREATEGHFAMEERALFPAFEETTGSTGGPTEMMRYEHGQMRTLFDEMAAAVEARDRDAFLGSGETLLMLMQQHNMKEEQILYPMTDRTLDQRREEVLGRMRETGAG